jgi:hypothetical protein
VGNGMEEIKNRNWIVQRHPFRHMIVRGLLEETVLKRLTENFERHLQAHNSDARRIANYDAQVVSLKSQDVDVFYPLLHVKFLELICRAMRLNAAFEIDGALHSHPPGSRSGWIHNDYNPGWFGRTAASGELFFNDGACNYRTGRMRDGQGTGICRVRYITLIFYLNNPNSKNVGGETGLYLSQSRSVEQADILVPPEDNTLLAFECTPHSWHSFRTTTARRNSITLWLHRPAEEAKKQWPHHDFVYWT